MTLKKALDHFIYYCNNPSEWTYTSNVNGPTNTSKSWPGNMYEVMSDIYGVESYEMWASEGRPYFRQGTGMAWVLPTLFKGCYTGETPSKTSRSIELHRRGAVDKKNSGQMFDMAGKTADKSVGTGYYVHIDKSGKRAGAVRIGK